MNHRLRLLAVAAALCCAGAVQAQSSVIAYGLLDMSAGSFEPSGGPRVWRAENGGMTTSFFGVRGNEDLGGGLSARFALNSFLRADTGAAGRFDGDAFWARDAYVGLSGAFGTSLLGRNTTPLFVSTLLFNAFGDSYAFSPSIRQLFTPQLLPFYGDTGWNNSLSYSSNERGGISVQLMGNLGEGAPNAAGKNYSWGMRYFNGPLGASFTWQKARNGVFGVPDGFSAQTTWQLGLSYDLGLAKLFGQYAEVDTNATLDTRSKLWSIGATVPLGGGKVLAQYGRTDTDLAGEPSVDTLSLGYDYELSKRTDVYGVYMNEKVSALSRGDTLAAGIRLRF